MVLREEKSKLELAIEEVPARPWRSFYNPVAASLTKPHVSVLGDLLAHAARDHGDRPCLTYSNATLSYLDTETLVRQAACGLANLGVRKGTKVGYMMPNHPSFTIFLFAVWQLGAIGVGLNPLYPADRLSDKCIDAEVDLIITLDDDMLLAKADAMRVAIGRRLVFVICRVDDVDPSRSALSIPPPDMIDAFTLFSAGNLLEQTEIDPETDLAVLQYTGGTTGAPKAAMLTHANLSVNVAQMHSWFPELKPGREVMLAIAPVTHISGVGPIQNFTIGLAGELVSLLRFDPAKTLDIIEKHKISVIVAPPTMFVGLLKAGAERGFDWSVLRSAQSGAGPVPAEFKRRFQECTGVPLISLYGMTETSPAAVYGLPAGSGHEHETGVPLPFTDVEIRSATDPAKLAATGEVGEICIRGPQVMKGYWKRPEETANAFVGDFFRSGDLGTMSAEGVITVVDRLKDIIIASGYNIYPTEVENAILSHPDVQEVAVIGVPDDYRGETVKAIVSLKGSATLDIESLRLFLKPKLSPMEIPRMLEIVDEVPRNENAKISRVALRARDAAISENADAGASA